MIATIKYIQTNFWVLFILLSLCLIDLVYSAYQHYHSKLDGDIAAVVVPKTSYQDVLDNPFGWKAVTEGKHYRATNRFFCHYSMKQYFSNIPMFFGRFTDKINALYWASGAFKTLVQLFLLLILGMYAHSLIPFRTELYITLLFILTPFFQTMGYGHVLGIINPSITYVFFYSWPFAMLLLFYYPFFKSFIRQEPPKIGVFSKIGLILLMVFLPFSSPINSPVILIITVLYICDLFLRFFREKQAIGKRVRKWFSDHVDSTTFFFFGVISLIALYSMYLGQFNSENPIDALPLLERYPKLLQGLGSMLTLKLGYPVLLSALWVSWYLFNKTNNKDTEKIRKLVKWAIVFFSLYMLLLPLGGYRPYRPYIVRTDTMLPVICGLIILYGVLAFYLLRNLSPLWRNRYAILLLIVIIIFSAADGTNFDQNTAEREGLQILMNSTADTIIFPKDQLVLSWENIKTPEDSRWNAVLIQQWGLTDTIQLYYNGND